MNLKHFGLFGILCLLALSCSDDKEQFSGDTGQGQIQASFKANYKVASPKAAEGEAATELESVSPEIQNFSVHLAKSDGSYDKTWETVAQFPVDEKFSTGAYTMEIWFGDMAEEGFEKPYYYGSTKFEVIDEETSTPSIEAKLGNTMVSLAYTDAFKNYFTDYSAKVHSSGGVYIDFSKDETRPAYVKPGKVSFQLSMEKTNGSKLSIEPAAIENAEACTHYRVTFDVNGGEVGDAVLTVTFDDSTEQEPIEIPLSDDLLTAPAPVITAKGFDNNTPLNIIEGDDASASVAIVAQSGLASVILATSSEFLASKGLPAEIDLMAATAEQKGLLASLGLGSDKVKGLWNNPDKMAVVDFSGIIPMLSPLNGNSTHVFTIQVKDVYGRTAETPAVLAVNAPAVIFSMSDAQKSEAGSLEGVFKLEFNGNMNNVSFKALNDYGVYEDAAVKSTVDNGDGTYTVTVVIPDNTSKTTVKGYYKGVEKSSVDVKIGMAFTLSANDYDVWATKAIVKVNGKMPEKVMSNIKAVYVNGTETSNYTADAASLSYTVYGLTPGTQNVIKIVADDEEDTSESSVSVSAEAAAQVGNADMEGWNIETKTKKADFLGSDKKYYTFHPYNSGETDIWWATNNDKAQGGTYALGIWYEGCFASCASYTTDVHGGSKAALIYVSGCGDSYANTSSTYVGGAMVGSMWIGNFDNKTVTQGHSFTSRPSSLSFWYKYTPYNTDAFKVVVSLLSGSETIASGTYEPAASSSVDTEYKQATVELNYSVTNKKATAICVQFLASNRTNVDSDDYFKMGTTITYPVVGDWTVHMGSVLKFDDIVLNY